MFGQSLLAIAGVCLGLMIVVFGVLPWCLRHFITMMEGPLGDFNEWHMTIKDGSEAFSQGGFWTAAIAELESEDATLIREWNSHASTGDRVSRQYRLNKATILLEWDRWNGLTISGDRHPTETIVERIIADLERSLES